MTHRRTADDLPQRKQPQHPDSYARDLNPAVAAGQNIGDPVPQLRAADVKELTRELRGFTLDELREIPVVKRGARLQQGATYFDLSQRRAFTATGGMQAPEDTWLVPKAQTPTPYYNRLIGVQSYKRKQ